MPSIIYQGDFVLATDKLDYVSCFSGLYRFPNENENIDEQSRDPVWTVPNVPLGPRYSAGIHSRDNPVITEQFYVMSRGGGAY